MYIPQGRGQGVSPGRAQLSLTIVAFFIPSLRTIDKLLECVAYKQGHEEFGDKEGK